MSELHLAVRPNFDPNEVSLSTINSALKHGFTLVAVNYETQRRLGRFCLTSLGVKFLRFAQKEKKP
jgi:hypothetical protein